MSQNISQSTQQNLVLAEQRTILSEDSIAGGLVLDNSMADTLTMHERSWHTEDILKRPIVLTTLAWTTSQTLGTDLYSMDLPNAIWDVSSALPSSILEFFTFYRSDLVLRFQLNSTKFHLGRLMAYFDPLYASSTATDIYRASGFPNIKLDASESTVAELHIPYVHFQNYLNTFQTTQASPMGRIHLLVLNPLSAFTGASTTVDVTILAYAKQPSLHVPVYSHTPPALRDRPTTNTSYNAIAQAWWDDIPILGNIIRNPGEAFNAASDVVSTGVQLWEGNLAGALKTGQSAISNTSFVLNHDYPVSVNAESNFMHHAVSNIASGKGVYLGTRLALNPLSSTIPLQGVLPTSTHEMSIDYIKQIPMLFSQFNWSTTSSQADRLFGEHVAPQYLCNRIGSSDIDLITVDPTYISHLALMFRFWRGSIILRLEAVCTQFHTGRLLIAYTPGLLVPPTLAQAMNSPSVILDLQQAKEIEFELPFQAVYPWLYTSLSNDATSGDDRLFSVLGQFSIYVLNTLIASNNVPTTISINLYVRGGKDLEFAVPMTPHAVVTTPPSTVKAVAQVGEEVEESSTRSDILASEEPVQLAKPVSVISKLPPFWSHGETFDSLLDYSRRSSHIVSYVLGSTTSTPNFIDFVQFQVMPRSYIAPQTITTVASTTISYYWQSSLDVVSDFFRCWRGSIRYKFVTNKSSVVQSFQAAYITPSFGNVAYLTSAASGVSLNRWLASQSVNAGSLDIPSKNPVLEVEVPYYSGPSLLVNADYNGSDTSIVPVQKSSVRITFAAEIYSGALNQVVTITTGTSTTTYNSSARVEVYISAGDDLHMFYLIPPDIRNLCIPFTAIIPPAAIAIATDGTLVDLT